MAESEESRPIASLDQLKKKKPVQREVVITASGDDGEPVEVSIWFEAIAAAHYDKLVAKCPPKQEDKKQGLQYNVDSFAPKIIAATCVQPSMSEDEAKELWESDNWNRGERMQLFMGAIEVCTRGLDAPFGSND